MRTVVRRALEGAESTILGLAFEGSFRERRVRPDYSGVRPQYMDVIEIPPHETDVLRAFAAASDAFNNADPSIFVSFLSSSLWVRLPPETPVGYHWFRVTSVSLGNEEIVYGIESLRFLPDGRPPSVQRHTRAEERPPPEPVHLDGRAVIEFFKIAFTVMTALIVGAFKLIEFLGEFTLRFMHETSLMIERSTPAFRFVMVYVSKVTAALFTFVTIMFRGDKPIPVRTSRQAITYDEYGDPRRNY